MFEMPGTVLWCSWCGTLHPRSRAEQKQMSSTCIECGQSLGRSDARYVCEDGPPFCAACHSGRATRAAIERMPLEP